MKTFLYSAACWAALAFDAGARAQSPGAELRILDVPPNYPKSVGLALSDDAGVTVGLAWSCDVGCTVGVRWDSKGRVSAFPGEPPGSGLPREVSPDGRLIVGRAMPPGSSVFQPVAWRDGVLEVLPLPPNSSHGTPSGISAHGRIIGGDAALSHTWPGRGFVRWVDGKVEDLSRRPGQATANYASGIDGQGRYIVGAGQGSGGIRAIRVDNVVEDLGSLPGARISENGAAAANHDGSRIVGTASSVATRQGWEAFLWSAPTGMVGLGAPPAAVQGSNARTIAREALVVGGLVGTNVFGEYHPFLWGPVRGRRNLNDILDALAVNRQGWIIDGVNDLNHDGTLMTGLARRGDERRAFLVRLPPWCWADCTGDDMVDFSDLLCFLNRFERAQDPRANPIDFFYCDVAPDDEIDFNDFLAFLNLYNKGCGQ
ncbi:MAG: hypothetical protein FJ255_01325 [Phycisphaerae bacterium]|nr:hypothetical protein [Phycisphaerae bacterium]